MHRLMVSLLALSMSTFATELSETFLRQCDSGVAYACYRYGKSLLAQRKSPHLHARGNAYVRRACTLAYKPACKQIRPTVKSQANAEAVHKAESRADECGRGLASSVSMGYGKQVAHVRPNSLLDQLGLRSGDEIVSINGVAFKNRKQLAENLDKGSAVINIRRHGRVSSVMVNCP